MIQVFRGGKWRKAAVATADSQGIFTGMAKTGYGRGRHGTVRAMFANRTAVPFPMKRVGDFHHDPFG
jgi:hypothetical protein